MKPSSEKRRMPQLTPRIAGTMASVEATQTIDIKAVAQERQSPPQLQQQVNVMFCVYVCVTVCVLRFGSGVSREITKRWIDMIDSSKKENIRKPKSGSASKESCDSAQRVDEVANPAENSYTKDWIEN